MVTEEDLEEFLAGVTGPTVIGFSPEVYPACVTCSRAWSLHRDKGIWAWYPDCLHKKAKCKLVRNG